MLIDPTADRTLVEVSDLDLPEPPPEVAAHMAVLRQVVGWAQDYLCAPHPDLGRKGDVCPFAKTALDDRTFFLTVQPESEHPVRAVVDLLRGYRDWFLRMGDGDPVRSQFHTILVIFPDLRDGDVHAVIDGAQAQLKADFVAEGLMIGEFHDGPPASPGLWNPEFRPLRSPVPLLAIRHMVPSDLPFLHHDPELLAGYLHRFGGRIPAHLRVSVAEALGRFGMTPADPDPALPEVPLTTGQQRTVFLGTLGPGNPVHHVARVLRLASDSVENRPASRARIAAGIGRAIAQHPVLRTVLAERDGLVVGAISSAAAGGVPVHHATNPDDAERLVARSIRRPFDLRRGPLLRAEVVQLSESESLLVITAHRLAADAAALDRICAGLGASAGTDTADTADTDTAGTDTADTDTADTEPADTATADTDTADTVTAASSTTDSGRKAAADRDYWRALLVDPPTLDLPTDRRRPAVQSYRGDVLRRRVKTTDRIRLATALIAVLARHSGQHDLLLGLPRRSAAGVGPRPATAVIRVDCSDGPALRTLLERCAEALLAADSHAAAGLEDVLDSLDVGHDLGVPPVFGVQLEMLDASPGAPQIPGTAVSEYPVDDWACEVDVSVRARPAPGPEAGTLLEIAFSADLFDPATVARLADDLATVLDVLDDVDGPTAGDTGNAAADMPLPALPLVDPDRRQEYLADGTGPALPLPDPATPLTLLQRAAAEHPDRPAVIGRDGELSHAELHRKAAALAHLLIAWGAGPDVTIGVCVDRSAAMVVALLGVWMSGAAYVPLDPSFPPDRLRLMVEDADIAVVVTDAAARDRIGGLLGDVPGAICLDADADVLAQQPDSPPEVTIAADDLAYVIYTSGSTGRPKGVEIPHRAVANLLVAFAATVPLRPDDRWLAVTTLSFDIAALELFHPLARGACVVVATGEEAGDGRLLSRRATTSGVTAMQATPAGWRLLLAAGPVPSAIRSRLIGGEAVPRDLADELMSEQATVWNVYGPTETTVWSAAGVIDPAPAPIEIGPAIANTTLQVLDQQGSPTPIGVVGEVFIGGDGLARGYRNNPELTAQRFVADPNRPGELLYATGDLARLRPGGRLAFVGRSDHQVKVRGHRIELGEIETVLRAHPDVRAAAVSSAPGPGGDHRLVAHVVGRVRWPDLQAWLRRSVPEYMVPGIGVHLDTLPLTPNGKLDRAALPDPTGSCDPAGRAAATPIERAVAARFVEVLGGPAPGADDDFFALGGHSLLGAKLLSLLRSEFDVELSVRTLFESPTVAGLAAALVEREPAAGQVAAIAELRERIAEMPDDEVAALLHTAEGSR